jgi:tetratricopeptide (TPR) repeat protein
LEQYEWALENIETWFARVENPGAEALFLAAQLYYVADQPLDALSFAERGLVRLIEPQQNWYEVAVAIYYENGKYDKAAPLIKEMIQLWPAKGYERLRPTREIREFESDYPLDIMRACELSRN